MLTVWFNINNRFKKAEDREQMGFITIWYDPTDAYIKTYREIRKPNERHGKITKTKAKTIREYYESVMLHANKNPDITAKIVKRAKDGFIAVDATIKQLKFT